MRESTTGNKLVSQLDYLHADRVRASGSVSTHFPTHLGLIIQDIIYILAFFLPTCPSYFLPHRPNRELCVCVCVRQVFRIAIDGENGVVLPPTPESAPPLVRQPL